jgi:UDPglucose 6-dehydrogenase
LKEGAQIKAFDYQATANAKKILKDKIKYSVELYGTIKDCDALLILTEWKQFRDLDWQKVKKLLKKDVIFDGRNMFSPQKMQELGFKYYSMGRKTI